MQLHRPHVLLLPFIPFLLILFIAALGDLFVSRPAHAELLAIMAEGEYRMGDRDTREDAVRLAVEAAKRNALEQVATYVESVTVTNALDITRDEIRSYTAGVVNVVKQHVGTRLEGDTVIIHVEITGQIDEEEVAQAIRTLRENDDAREQVKILRTEVDELHRQLDDATVRLSAAMSPERQQLLTQQRQDLLDCQDRGWLSANHRFEMSTFHR